MRLRRHTRMNIFRVVDGVVLSQPALMRQRISKQIVILISKRRFMAPSGAKILPAMMGPHRLLLLPHHTPPSTEIEPETPQHRLSHPKHRLRSPSGLAPGPHLARPPNARHALLCQVFPVTVCLSYVKHTPAGTFPGLVRTCLDLLIQRHFTAPFSSPSRQPRSRLPARPGCGQVFFSQGLIAN